MPRVAGRQMYRVNVSSSFDEEYFRVAQYFPYLDYVIAELERRFQQHNASMLIPNKTNASSTIGVSELVSQMCMLYSQIEIMYSVNMSFGKNRGKKYKCPSKNAAISFREV